MSDERYLVMGGGSVGGCEDEGNGGGCRNGRNLQKKVDVSDYLQEDALVTGNTGIGPLYLPIMRYTYRPGRYRLYLPRDRYSRPLLYLQRTA